MFCRKKGLVAAANFQLRWAPNMLAAASLRETDALGPVHDMEVQVNVHTPWELWNFLAAAPRLEILYRSIHYIDLVRAWLGGPRSVYAKTVRSPRTPDLAATRSVIVLDCGDPIRAYIATNHSHDFAPILQRSYVQWEGTEAALQARMGAILNCPTGKPDSPILAEHGQGPTSIPIAGNWFPTDLQVRWGRCRLMSVDYRRNCHGSGRRHPDDAHCRSCLSFQRTRRRRNRTENRQVREEYFKWTKRNQALIV